MVLQDISRAVDSSIALRNKKDLIESFIASLNPSSEVDDEWATFVKVKRREELERIISEEKLSRDETFQFMEDAFRNGFVQTTGTSITKVLPPVSRFTPTGERTRKRESVLEKLKAFFERFRDIVGIA